MRKKIYFKTTDKMEAVAALREQALDGGGPMPAGTYPGCTESLTVANSDAMMLLVTNTTGALVLVKVFGAQAQVDYVVDTNVSQLGPFPLGRWGEKIVVSHPEGVTVFTG